MFIDFISFTCHSYGSDQHHGRLYSVVNSRLITNLPIYDRRWGHYEEVTYARIRANNPCCIHIVTAGVTNRRLFKTRVEQTTGSNFHLLFHQIRKQWCVPINGSRSVTDTLRLIPANLIQVASRFTATARHCSFCSSVPVCSFSAYNLLI